LLEAAAPAAFVREGDSARFGALYADVVFAKDALVDWCRRDGVPFVPWSDFDDVRARLPPARGRAAPPAARPARSRRIPAPGGGPSDRGTARGPHRATARAGRPRRRLPARSRVRSLRRRGGGALALRRGGRVE